MPKNIRKTISFKPKASKAKNGLALIFDLERFSKFFNQPDVQDYIPKFLNHIFNSISIVINGGNAYWYNEVELRSISPLLNPIHQKFMGDGGLYIWTPSKESGDFTIDFITQLSNRLWDLKNHFDAVLKSCADDVPVYELPRRIRFGLARGTIYELSHTSSIKKEYIGFCINLASRLQKYCPELGFIASARLGLPKTVLEEYEYIKVVATKLVGFPKEIVIIDKNEYDGLNDIIKQNLFEEL